jgi:aspartate 1-decarboxylase
MLRYMCKSKIHRPTVTEANLKYMGSITIDRLLLKAADILAYERVQVVNINNGTRFETYVIAGRAGSGTVCLNGPAARWGEAGDEIIIMSYALMKEEELKDFKAKIIFVDKKNRIIKSGISK